MIPSASLAEFQEVILTGFPFTTGLGAKEVLAISHQGGGGPMGFTTKEIGGVQLFASFNSSICCRESAHTITL